MGDNEVREKEGDDLALLDRKKIWLTLCSTVAVTLLCAYLLIQEM